MKPKPSPSIVSLITIKANGAIHYTKVWIFNYIKFKLQSGNSFVINVVIDVLDRRAQSVVHTFDQNVERP